MSGWPGTPTKPAVPGRIPLMDVHFVIRYKDQVYVFAGFTYLCDALALLEHLKTRSPKGMVYELVDLMTGKVIAATSDPS